MRQRQSWLKICSLVIQPYHTTVCPLHATAKITWRPTSHQRYTKIMVFSRGETLDHVHIFQFFFFGWLLLFNSQRRWRHAEVLGSGCHLWFSAEQHHADSWNQSAGAFRLTLSWKLSSPYSFIKILTYRTADLIELSRAHSHNLQQPHITLKNVPVRIR